MLRRGTPIFWLNINNVHNMSILLLNVQSLQAHKNDIENDINLTKVDIMILTETWLKNSNNINIKKF